MEPEVTPPEAEYSHEQYVELARKDFADFVNNALTMIWNARDRLLLKGKANYIGPFLEIYSIMYEACPDNCPLERELWDRSEAVLTTITGNGPDLSVLEDKEDEYHSEDDENEEVKAAKMVKNAEKLLGIILGITKSPVKKEEK
jgi:hypothetical protein